MSTDAYVAARHHVEHLDDEAFVELVADEVERRNDTVMSDAEARRNAGRIETLLATIFQFEAA